MTPAELKKILAKPGSKPHKFGAEKVTVGDVRYDSKAEAALAGQLALLLRAGEISDLRRQVPLALVPGAKLHGEARTRPAIRVVVDFVYVVAATGETVWLDAKGMETPESRIKRHLAKALHGIDIRIWKRGGRAPC